MTARSRSTPAEGGRDRAHGLADRAACARAVRARRPGGRTSPPARRESAARPRSARRRARRAGCCRWGLRTVSISCAQVDLHLLDAHRRPVEQVGQLVFVRPGGRERLDRELRPVAVRDRVARRSRARRCRARRARGRRGVVPADRRPAAGGVGERQAQEVLAVALLRERALLHEEDGIDRLAVLEVAQEQLRRALARAVVTCKTKIESSTRTMPRLTRSRVSGLLTGDALTRTSDLVQRRHGCAKLIRLRAAATAERGRLPVRVLAKVGEASLKGRNRRYFLDTPAAQPEGGAGGSRRPHRRRRLGDDDRGSRRGASPTRSAPGSSASSDSPTPRSASPASATPEAIATAALLAFERARPASFAVRVRRRDKSFPLTSQDLEREIGAAIQRARPALPVDLTQARPRSCASSSTTATRTCTSAS